MDKIKMAKFGLSLGSMLLTTVATLVSNKATDAKMKDFAEKAVKEALSNQAKGS